MRIVTLIPLTKRGKQLVKQHGDRWMVQEKRDHVLYTPDIGPWLLCLPITEEQAPADDMRAARIESASRWVHEHTDENFKVAP